MKKILILNFIVMSMFNFAHPVTPDMLIDKGAPTYLNGILYALMSLSMFLFSPYWGNKVDKNGAKKYLVLGPLIYGTMQLLFGFGKSSLAMGLGRFLAGVFAACFIVALMQYINLISPTEKRAKNFGLIMVTNGIGGVVGQLLAGMIGANGGMYIYVPFVIQFVLGIIIALFVYYVIPELKSASQTTEQGKRNPGIKSSVHLIKENQLAAILVTMLMLAIANNLYTSHIGYFVAEVYQFNPFAVSLVNSYANFIIMLTNLFLINYIRNKFGILTGIKYEFIIAIFTFTTIFYLPIKIAIVFLGMFIASIAIYRPLVQDYVVSKDNNHGGELMGIVNSVNSLGMIIGSVSSGFLFTINELLPFYVIVIILLIGLLIFIFRVEKGKKTKKIDN